MVRGMVLGIALAAAVTAGAADVATVSHGEEVRLEEHLAPGKLVLVDFYADWCGPCRMLTPRLERLAADHPDELALRKVDIVRWDSPVARQHRIRAVPHLRLYDTGGAMLADGDAGRVLAMLEQRLGGSGGGGPRLDPSPGRSGSTWIPILAVLTIVGVAAFVLLRRPRPTSERGSPAPPGSAVGPPPVAPNGAQYFAMIQGSLEGPFSAEQLADLVRRRVISGEAQVRRRGEAAWRELAEVLEP